MSIVLARVDNRLIHGQVLEAWVPHVHADCIMVANDRVAEVPLQKALMEAAVPSGIRVVIGSIEMIAGELSHPGWENSRILLLFETSYDALVGHRSGMQFAELNLGNMHAETGKVRFSCTIALGDEDIRNLHSLETEEGVSITCQCIPADRGRSWRKLLGKDGVVDGSP